MTSDTGANARVGLRPEYAGFFDCFNRAEYFRAHEVLEALWLQVRNEPVGDFYKGLIQLAGAFVHVQKGRAGSALALLGLAEENLAKYPAPHEGLDTAAALALIRDWQARLEQGIDSGVLSEQNLPQLAIVDKIRT